MTTTGLLDIDTRELKALQRDFRAVSKDFANAMQNELRGPVQRGAADFKAAARANFPSWARADAASTIRASSSNRSGYAIKRENNSRFTQDSYSNRTSRIRHPLFGNKDYWYDTFIPGLGGWWDNQYRETVPRATDEFTAALMKIIDRIAAGDLSTSKIATGKTRTKTVL